MKFVEEGYMYYHASPVYGIDFLEPRISNHGEPLIYFSEKRENVLVYLSNAVEKYCKETDFHYSGKWHKWGSYGFTEKGVLRLEEYYPNSIIDTYKGVSAYIYSTETIPDVQKLSDIPYAITTNQAVKVQHCEFIPDAYEEIMKAAQDRKIIIEQYENISESKRKWIKEMIIQEYRDNQSAKDYKHFLLAKFPFLTTDL